MVSDQLNQPLRRTTTGSIAIPMIRESGVSDLAGQDPASLRQTRMRNIVDRKQILDMEYQ